MLNLKKLLLIIILLMMFNIPGPLLADGDDVGGPDIPGKNQVTIFVANGN